MADAPARQTNHSDPGDARRGHAGDPDWSVAEAILDALLNGEDVSDATHGNYDGAIFRQRVGALWRGRIAEVLTDTVQAASAAGASSKTPMMAALAFNTPWPAPALLRRLADAADHLLTVHDCDAHGWEGVRLASDQARRMADRIELLRAASAAGASAPPEALAIKALKNYGADVECGACMEVAFTGVTTNEHTCQDHTDHVEVALKAEPLDLCRCKVLEKRARVLRMNDVLKMQHDSELMKELRSFELVASLQVRIEVLEKALRALGAAAGASTENKE